MNASVCFICFFSGLVAFVVFLLEIFLSKNVQVDPGLFARVGCLYNLILRNFSKGYEQVDSGNVCPGMIV